MDVMESISSDHQDRVRIQEHIRRQIEEITSGEQRNLSRVELYRFYELYKSWAEFSTKPQRRRHERKILYFALQQFFWMGIDDGSVIAWLLKNLHQLDNGFHILLCPDEFTCPSFVDVAFATNCCFPLQYFLRHAYQEKLLFNGIRLANSEMFMSSWKTPCEIAVENEYPELLLLLLRYGALMRPGDGHSCRTRFGLSLSTEPLLKLLRECIRKIPDSNLLMSTNDGTPGCKSYEALYTCIKLLLRASPHFKIHRLYRQSCGRMKPSFQEMCNNVNILSYSFPVLPNRCLYPVELKHACRLVIRQTLHNNWSLPEGLNSMGLPRRLKNYLDLLSD